MNHDLSRDLAGACAGPVQVDPPKSSPFESSRKDLGTSIDAAFREVGHLQDNFAPALTEDVPRAGIDGYEQGDGCGICESINGLNARVVELVEQLAYLNRRCGI